MAVAREDILTPESLVARVRAAQAAGDRVVLCHGCFDIVHPGHVRHLTQAARLGDRLVVTVSGDATIAKGVGRPLIPAELRAENLAALDCVDWVSIWPEPTAAAMLDRVRPDVYVKGREYETNADPRFAEEKRVVEAAGGRVVFTSGDVVFSSTALIGAMEATTDPRHAQLRALAVRLGLDAPRIDRLLSEFRDRRVLVVGETIVDVYVTCDRPEVASEGPMMTLRPLERRSFDGGAAIVARHLAALGAKPVLVTPLPAGPGTEALRLRLEVEGVTLAPLAVERPLPEKHRFLVGETKVVKLDLGERIVLDDAQRRRVVAESARIAGGCDAAVITDFGLGFLTQASLGALAAAVRPRVELLVGDVSGRRSNLGAMRGFDLLCPSELELRDALHAYDEGLSAVVCRLLDETRSRAALVKLGGEGLIAFRMRPEAGSEEWTARLEAAHVPPLVAHAVDPLGCGDALLAAATLTLLAGRTLEEAALVGAAAAGEEARILGNAVIGAPDLRRGLRRLAEARLTVGAGAASAPTSDAP